MLERGKLILPVVVVGLVAAAAIVSAAYFWSAGGNTESLPAGCSKPPGGFLVIAGDSPGNVGFNDSQGHGAPTKPWPVMTVEKGTTVEITICNTDTQAHSFNIAHYLDNRIETLAPGQVIKVQFVADQAGTFRVYCAIFCTIHIFMQNGELIVK